MKPYFVLPGIFTAALLALNGCGGKAPDEPQPVAAAKLAGQLEQDLRKIGEEAGRLATSLAELYPRRAEILPGIDRSKYDFAPNGAFAKMTNDGGAALWVSGAVPITAEVQEIAYFTEAIDPELIRITRTLPEVAQAYYNDRHSLNRIYPWFDAIAQYPPKMNIPEFNFYYLADATHNPGRKPVWVDEPYVDPAGRGWMVSAIAPVYVQETLAGVVGLDVTIATIVDRYLKPQESPIAVIDRNGVLVAATERAIELMRMPPLKDHKYLETVKQDTFKPDEYNALKSRVREVREMAEQLLKKGEARSVLPAPPGAFTALAVRMPEVGWTVVEFIPR